LKVARMLLPASKTSITPPSALADDVRGIHRRFGD
jgi:hypothetical protein